MHSCFNPRTHTGCDQMWPRWLTREPLFQSTHPHGVRLDTDNLDNTKPVFQSTHPHGVRLGLTAEVLFVETFQSTHPHGVRQYTPYQGNSHKEVSIHAPTRGATQQSLNFVNSSVVSIHAPTRGATFQRSVYVCLLDGFNPRTHTGCDTTSSMSVPKGVVSIHAPTRGATGSIASCLIV